MKLLVVGTFPERPGDVLAGPVALDDELCVKVGQVRLPCCQGTAAMLSAAAVVARHLGAEPPFALLGGDIGRGDGTRAIASTIARAVEAWRPSVVAFHYMQPVLSLIMEAVPRLSGREAHGAIRLVADAGGMYAAKAAGVAHLFELMTPDIGEIGFLADPECMHPAYASRCYVDSEACDPVELARRAQADGGGARVLLVKGHADHVVADGQPIAVIDSPDVPALEAIGGTGDTLTGIAAALMAAGFATVDAAVCAARANREAGAALGARPDHRAADLVARVPEVLASYCPGAASCQSPTTRSLS